MKRTPFYNFHQEHGAKFIEFAGWEMPIHYGSILEEHKQTREAASLFDVSHMGRIKVSGRHARRFLERVLTRRITDMKEMTARYSLICNEQGGVKDDLLVYRFPDHWLLVVNAVNRAKLMDHFNANRGEMIVNIDDQTESTAMVAVQGPKVMDIIGQFSSEVPTLGKFHFCIKNLMILKMTISRTGYTGEDGVEVILPAKMAGMAVKLLLRDKGEQAASIKPAGLGCRDSLRMEAAMPLYGHELDEHINPLAAGLDFAVNLDKGDENGETFIGQEALKKIAAEGGREKLIGLKVDGRRTPREKMDVLKGDTVVGHLTSGCLSPTLGHPIAMAYVSPDVADLGTTLAIKLGGKTADAQVVELPFYKRKA